MSILSKIKSKASSALKKAATYTYNTVNSIGSAIKGAITGGKGGQLVAGVINSIPRTSSGTDGLDYTGNRQRMDKFSGSITPYGASGSWEPTYSASNPGKVVSSPISYGPPKTLTVSSGTKLSSKSNYSSPSYGTDLAALSASNFMTGGPISTTVNASNLSSQAGSTGGVGTLPPAPSPTDYRGSVLEKNTALGANPDTGMMQTPAVTTVNDGQKKEDAPVDATTAFNAAMTKLFKQKDSSEELYKRAREGSGILAAQQQRQNTQNEINGITSNMNSQLLRLEGQGRGIPLDVIGGQQAQITREATIRLLPLQAQLAIDQGNLEMAESNLDTLFKIYSKDAQDSYDFYANQAKTIYDKATKDEQRQLDAITEQKKFEQSIVKDQANAQQSYMSQALKDANIRLFNALKGIQPPTNINSPSYAQDKQNYIDDINEAVSSYGAQETTAGTYNPKQLQAISKINQDVSKNSTYSKTTSMRNYGDNVIASLQLGSGVGDIAAINQFQKVIDEGAVTRDQDVKLIQGSQSLANTLKTKIKKLEKGEQLSPELRKQMRDAVETMYAKQVEALQKDPYIAAKTREAELYGITAGDTILGELGAFTQNQNTTGDGATKVYNGVTYKVINGVWTPQ